MKITKITLGIFLSAFLIGCVSFATYIYLLRVKQKETHADESTELANNQIYVPTQLPPETTSLKEQEQNDEWYEKKPNYKVKLLTPGEFHGEEVTAKSGEKWLGLFRENDQYFLRFTKIKVRRVLDPVFHDIDLKESRKTGKEVDVNNENKPIFLIKNAAMLHGGKVLTLFSQTDGYENNSMLNGFTKDFNLNGTNYTLKVVGDNPSNESLDVTSKLVLISGNSEQIVYKLGACDDCGWSLFWVGDLDGDGKLDLFADLNYHYNVTSRRLFLSSQAKDGELVKEVAIFSTVGC